MFMLGVFSSGNATLKATTYINKFNCTILYIEYLYLWIRPREQKRECVCVCKRDHYFTIKWARVPQHQTNSRNENIERIEINLILYREKNDFPFQ